jgi:hypothetical protein
VGPGLSWSPAAADGAPGAEHTRKGSPSGCCAARRPAQRTRGVRTLKGSRSDAEVLRSRLCPRSVPPRDGPEP